MAALTPAQRARMLDALALRDEAMRRARRRLLWALFPDAGPDRRELYPRHMEFFAAGTKVRERAFIAANRIGKTVGAGAEWAYHLTGRYPAWWPGYRFQRPIRLLASGDTHETTRDILQDKLLGGTTDQPDKIGTGLIPGDDIKLVIPRPHVRGAIERATVRHVSGGESELWLRSYEQGREIFQGFELDGFWADEECPEDVYDEGQVRLMTRRGLSTLTFTPLKGLTPLVQRLMAEPEDAEAPRTRIVVPCSWDDVPHLDAQTKAELLASLPPHQRDARTKGIPSLGSGAIYPVPESEITCEPFAIPRHWPRGYALDVGWRRTAATWGALDRESDTLYLYSEHYRGEAEPSVHAAAIRARGDWMTGAIDPAARGRSQKDGEQMLQLYRDLGLNLVPAVNGVEAGLYEVLERLSTGRMKLFTTLRETLGEYRVYRRDEKGRVVKERDHAMDSMRYIVTTSAAVLMAPPIRAANHQPIRQEAWRAALSNRMNDESTAQAA